MTIKEYARERGVSYEAVRRMIKRHAGELEGHIVQPGNNQAKELDAEAVELLDGWRTANPVAVIQQDRAVELERLRKENDVLKSQVIALQGQLLEERGARLEMMEAQRKQLQAPKEEQEQPPLRWWQRIFR